MPHVLSDPKHLTESLSAMNDATAAILCHDTCSPQEFRRIVRAGRNATYDAIASGAIPSFRVGTAIKIPTSWLRAKLGIEVAQ
jgi:hypothetical protein